MEEDNKKGKIIEEKKETLVVDEQKRVIDIETILSEKKENTLVNAVNNLINCGSDYSKKGIIKEKFNARAGNIVDETIALDILKDIFEATVKEINMNDEAISVKADGKIDEKATEKKLRALGIKTNTNSYEERLQEHLNGKREITDFFKSEEHIQKKYQEVGDFLSKQRANKKENEEIDATKVDENIVGKELFSILEESCNRLDTYNEKLMELISLQEKLDKSKGTSEFEKANEEFTKLKKELEEKNPEIINEYIGKNGEIKEEKRKEYLRELNTYNDDKVKISAITAISYIKQNGIENLTSEQLLTARQRALAGLKIADDKTRELIAKELEQVIPGFEFSKDLNNKENRIAIEKALGYDKNLQVEGFEALLDILYNREVRDSNSKQIAENIKSQKNLENIPEETLENFFKMNSQELTVEYIENYKNTREQRYFKDSKLEFSDNDEQMMKDVYQNTTIGSWIDTKARMLNYRYSCLLNSKDELEKNEPRTRLIDQRLRKINKEIEEFKTKFPNVEYSKFIDDSGNFTEHWKTAATSYTSYRIASKLSRDFTEDADKVKNINDYNNLSDDEKKVYLRNTIVALNFENSEVSNKKIKESNKILSKFAKRRLEILNTPDNKFINIKNNQNTTINFNAILEEYNRLSSYEFKDYTELLNYCELNTLEYVNSKLKVFEALDENAFNKIPRGNPESQLKQIEAEKIASWNKEKTFANLLNASTGKIDDLKINDLQLSDDVKKRIMQLDAQINAEDKDLMEFQRLQNLISMTLGDDKKEAKREIEELIRKNPNKKAIFLECVKNPNETIKRLNAYSERIVEKNALLSVGAINSLSDEELQDLVGNPKLKRQILLTLVGSLGSRLAIKEEELVSAIQKICPNSKILDENGNLITSYEVLPQLLGQELDIKDCDLSTVGKIIESAKIIMLQNENSKKIDNVDEKDINIALDIEGLSKLSKIFKDFENPNELIQTREEKYFVGSQMKYTGDDVLAFEELYHKSISKSWIENKETAERLKYIFWIKDKEIRDKKLDISEDDKRIYDEKLELFEKEHPNLNREEFIKNGKILDKPRKELEKYTEMKFIGDLMSDYVMDEDRVTSADDYNRLLPQEKKKYMRKTLLGLLEENGENEIVSKLAIRRLELISTDEKSFIITDENNNLKVDKDVFFNEFDSLFSISKAGKVNSFEGLEKAYARVKEQYARTKLNYYAASTDEFIKVSQGDDYTRAREIERHKEKNALERLLIGSKTRIEQRSRNPKEESSNSLDNRSSDDVRENR